MIKDIKYQEAEGRKVSDDFSTFKNCAIKQQNKYYTGVATMIVSIVNLLCIAAMRFIEDLGDINDNGAKQ
jgi:hypothetical protein